jgi:adenosylhomocysteine nucleosidase
MNSTIGLVTALPSEARALMGRGPWQHAGGHLFRRSILNNSTRLMVVRSGMGMENAFLASQWLISEGVAALGVSGVSGGLDPGLAPGDLVLADSIIQENPDTDRHIWEGNPKFVETSYDALIAKGIPAYRGPIISVQKPVLSARDKQALFTRTSALAVDMESAAVAAAASKASIPFFALRAVCDAAARSIPTEIFDCLNQAGRVRPLHLFWTLLLSPTLISDLLCMKRDFALASAALGQAWNTLMRSSLPALLKDGDP